MKDEQLDLTATRRDEIETRLDQTRTGNQYRIDDHTIVKKTDYWWCCMYIFKENYRLQKQI